MNTRFWSQRIVAAYALVALAVMLSGGQAAYAYDIDGCSAANVSEFGEYSLVYALNISGTDNFDGTSPTYATDNSATVGGFDRVAYCLELDTGGGLEWVWVSFDAFTGDPAEIGVPVSSTGATFQHVVSKMNVFSNSSSVTTGSDIATGNIEFWHNASSQVGALGLGGNDGLYDFDDSAAVASGAGSMQIHNNGAGQTVFAYNNWDSAAADDLGIGNSGGLNPDWTDAANAATFATRKDLYVLVREVEMFTYAGTGVAGFQGNNGPATSARMEKPTKIAFDAADNAYVSDFGNNRIRRIDNATGIMSSYAGTGNPVPTLNGDGLAGDVDLDGPVSVGVDDAGNVYFAELNAHIVRKIDTLGNVTTIAGTAGVPGGSSNRLRDPYDVAVTASGDVYIADRSNHRVQKVDGISGAVTTVAGNGNSGFSGDGGPATTANLSRPRGVFVDSSDNLYIADSDNRRIRRVDAATSVITTIAGNGSNGNSGDGGSATSAAIGSPRRVFVDGLGQVYLSDTNNSVVRKVDTSGNISTIAGTGFADYTGEGFGPTQSALNVPQGVVLDSNGTLYIVDEDNHRIRHILQADNNNPPSDIAIDNLTVNASDGPNTKVGQFSTIDDPADNGLHVYSLVPGLGGDDNDLFKFGASNNRNLLIKDPVGLSGDYLIRVSSDDQNSGTVERTFVVTVNGISGPTITLNGGDQTIELNGAYVEQGATATDVEDGDLTGSITIDDSAVDTTTVGVYLVRYEVTDSDLNTAAVDRTVTVEDTTIPVITLVGDNPLVIAAGTVYADPGATADDAGVDISADIVVDDSAVDTSTLGDYSVTYDVTDGGGNAAVQVTRTVTVVDASIPIITLIGSDPIIVTVGTVYVDPGATADDDGVDISADIVIDASMVDTSTLGNYTVTFNITDADGNMAIQVTRTVNVIAATVLADLNVNASGPSAMTVGDSAQYTVTVANAGPDGATQVVASISAPSILAVSGATAGQGSCTVGGANINCDLGDIASGGSATITVDVSAASAGSGDATANASSAVGDPNMADNSGTAAITVSAAPPPPPPPPPPPAPAPSGGGGGSFGFLGLFGLLAMALTRRRYIK